jgi:hypothetical protein
VTSILRHRHTISVESFEAGWSGSSASLVCGLCSPLPRVINGQSLHWTNPPFVTNQFICTLGSTDHHKVVCQCCHDCHSVELLLLHHEQYKRMLTLIYDELGLPVAYLRTFTSLTTKFLKKWGWGRENVKHLYEQLLHRKRPEKRS